MAKAPPAKPRGGSSGGSNSNEAAAPRLRERPVGRPLQARLIALEMQIGLFSEEPPFATDSRFNHPVILPAEAPLPDSMARVFAAELAARKRFGRPIEACHATALGAYRVYCASYFHYDGFKALLCVERDGRLVAAWKEEEVLQPASPRTFLAGVPDAEIQALLERIGGA